MAHPEPWFIRDTDAMETTWNPDSSACLPNQATLIGENALEWDIYARIKQVSDRKDFNVALRMINESREQTASIAPPIACLEAACLDGLGDLPGAIAVLEAAIRNMPENYWVHYTVAALYQRAGRTEDCIAAYRHAHAATGWSESQERCYIFLQDYFSSNIPNWTEWFAKHIIASPIEALEIGAWQGGSTTWLLDKIISRRGGRLTSIDTFEGSSEHMGWISNQSMKIEEIFDHNVKATGHGALNRKLVGRSQEVMRQLNGEQFDFIYIDGAHEARYVIEDAVLAFGLIKPGGFILFDDYDFRFPTRPQQDTRVAIDGFTGMYADEVSVVQKGRQLLLRRNSGIEEAAPAPARSPASSVPATATDAQVAAVPSDDDILAAANAVIAGREPGLVLRDLYHRSEGQKDAVLDHLASVLPSQQSGVMQLIDRLCPPSLTTVVILLAALRTMRSPEEWLHYSLANQLMQLHDVGVLAARLPAALHAQSANETLRTQSPTSQGMMQMVLGRTLATVAPRYAIQNGLVAVRGGAASALRTAAAAFELLGIRPLNQRATISHMLSLSKLLHMPTGDLPPTVLLPQASLHRTTQVEPRRRVIVPPVHGDREYYLFSQSGQEVDLREITIHHFEHGTISIDATTRGNEQHYVFDSDGRCVEELSNGVTPFISDEIIEINEPLAILDDQFSGAMNICHFLLDRMTRIQLYDRAWATPGKFLLIDGYPYYRDIIARMGMTDRFIIPSSKRITIRAPEILFSSNIAHDFQHPAHSGSSWSLNYLRQILKIEDRPARPGRKLMINRTDAGSRRILNWTEVEPVFTRRGFEVVELSSLPANSQIELFSDVSQVCSVHGAGLTNLLFAPRECAVLEILPPLVASGTYWLMINGLGQRYQTLIAKDRELPRPDYRNWQHQPEYYNQRDVIIPVEWLETALNQLAETANAPAAVTTGEAAG